ncbi:MAG: hypothetical protein K1X64_14515 [Myxococcaceae bacterium]|nr:hypothetical protein [Myxococcaceae bacterium]
MLSLLAWAWLAATPAAHEDAPAAHGAEAAAPEPPAVPEAPTAPEPLASPVAAEASTDAGVTPRAERPPVSLPSLAPSALCAELRQGGDERAAKKNRWQEERKVLAAERARLEKLAADIATAREGLKVETARLEKLVKANAARATADVAAPEPADVKALPKKNDPEQLANLAKTMKAMKPEQAAALVQRLDRALAVDLIGRLSPAVAGAVIAKLSPELAAEMMTRLATRTPDERKK